MPGMQPSQPIPRPTEARLSPTEVKILEAFLQPEVTILAVLQALRLSLQQLLDAFASPSVRAALDTLIHLDAIRRRLALAPIVPGALTALRRLLDQNDKPAEVRRAATTILNTYTRLERVTRATDHAALRALRFSTPSPRAVGANGHAPARPQTPAAPPPDALTPSPFHLEESPPRPMTPSTDAYAGTGTRPPAEGRANGHAAHAAPAAPPRSSGQQPVANRQSPDRRPSAPSADSRHRVAALAAAAGQAIRAGPAP